MNRLWAILFAVGCYGGAVWWAFSQTSTPATLPFTGINHPNGQQFAGSASCQNCHRDLYQTHLTTAHYRTSQPATGATVRGSFATGQNDFPFGPNARVLAERRAGKLYQVGYVDDREVMAQPFNLVIGSGRKGQTYLYWHNDRLFQLPVSYYAPTQSWSNSPGFPSDVILFNRTIPGRCLECHTTYAQKTSLDPAPERFDPKQLSLGINCERCHGPSARHVTYHREHPAEKIPRYVINVANLPRQQRLDACALCHSGLRRELKPAFAFVTGNTLTDFSEPDYSTDSLANLDVHGNQYGLLTASQCFQQSPNMDCSSCHNTHVNESDNLALFSARCMTCHTDQKFCKLKTISRTRLKANCIDCHMPVTASHQLTLQLKNRANPTPNVVRTHRIAVYDRQLEETLSYLKRLPGQSKKPLSESHTSIQ